MWAVNNCGIQSSLLHELCDNNVPELDDGRVNFYAVNDLIKDFMNNKAIEPILSTYQKAGFPKFTINTMVDETESQERNSYVNNCLLKSSNLYLTPLASLLHVTNCSHVICPAANFSPSPLLNLCFICSFKILFDQ